MWRINEIKNRLLFNVSYNIRTSLNSVVDFSQLIASELNIDKEIRQGCLSIIHKSSEKSVELINDIPDLPRLKTQMTKF